MFNEIGAEFAQFQKDSSPRRHDGHESFFLARNEKLTFVCFAVFVVNFWCSLKKFFHAQTDRAKCFAARIFAVVEKRGEQGCGLMTQL